ncbi:hypothetical protein TNCV_2229551, partial [Trichonephila clavipes]
LVRCHADDTSRHSPRTEAIYDEWIPITSSSRSVFVQVFGDDLYKHIQTPTQVYSCSMKSKVVHYDQCIRWNLGPLLKRRCIPAKPKNSRHGRFTIASIGVSPKHWQNLMFNAVQEKPSFA